MLTTNSGLALINNTEQSFWISLLLGDSCYIEKTLSKCMSKMAWILIMQDDEVLHERKAESIFP